MTVKELLNVYFRGSFLIWYVDGSEFINLIEESSSIENLTEDIAELKVLAFHLAHSFYGIDIMVDKPSWV